MVVKVKGMKAARLVAAIMERHTEQETGIHRGEDTAGVYWVSNTYLLPEGEQEVLDRIPRGTLLHCSGCSHQRTQQPSVNGSNGRGLSQRTKDNLAKLAAELRHSQALAEEEARYLKPDWD